MSDEEFGWDDVNVAQQDPEIVAVADELLRLYGETGVYETDRDLYSDASAVMTAARGAKS